MDFTSETFDLQDRPDREITTFLESRRIGLTLEEARQLQFSILKRPPSIAEFILFGIEGSEHCSYKSSRDHLKRFITEGEHVVLGAKEDAGVVRVTRDDQGRGYCVVISHESHNHPSQIVPYEGAATGVGGNVRDICCMGAEVVALADDLRFGEIESARTRWIYDGVVSGIAGYGNPIGVPSIAGGVQFDAGYQDNCLVTVVSLGILREDQILHSYAPKVADGVDADGYDLILVGKPTDSSGFGGASFASFDLFEDRREQNKGAVQEPNAFLGRHLLQSSNALFAKLGAQGASGAHHRVGFKDLGAGGIACAGVEIAESGGYGAEIDIDLVHTDGEGLPPEVILCSETQERYMWAAPADLTPMILEHYNREYALPEVSRGAEARVIGRITASPQFRVHAGGVLIVDAPAAEVTKGFLYHRPYTDPPGAAIGSGSVVGTAGPVGAKPPAVQSTLLQLLAHPNIASRAPLYESYDKQVQGRAVLEAGAADSGIIAPFNNSDYPREVRELGITLTTDQNPRMNRRDAYHGAVLAVVESYCNTVATGAEPLAVSDCLCYGNPETEGQMGQFVAGCRGVADACRQLSLPVVAGNVSLYNESSSGSIPPSPMIACVGRLQDYRRHLPGRLRAAGSRLYLVLDRTGCLGGSVVEELLALVEAPLPPVDYARLRAAGTLLQQGADRGLFRSCHDISEGGLAVALCEMSFTAGVAAGPAAAPGWRIELPAAVDPFTYLFEESPGFVLEIGPDEDSEFRTLCEQHQIVPVPLGFTTAEPRLVIAGVLELALDTARERWDQGLRERL